MMLEYVLRLSGQQHLELKSHLFPGDGKEAIALMLCGRRSGENRHFLSVWKILRIPHEECQRSEKHIQWNTDRLVPLLKEASENDLALVKVHSHPGGYEAFSDLDDIADRELFTSVYGWIESDLPHCSVIMLPEGKMFGRVVDSEIEYWPLDLVTVCGDSINYWFHADPQESLAFTARHAQVLGETTTALLRRLRCAVIGCSGTGSPTIEQLYRLGVGELVLIDPDNIEEVNLNRILNSRMGDAECSTSKVEVMARTIEDANLGTDVITYAQDLCQSRIVKAVAECDVVFGCVDSVLARHVLNKIASTYCIPYFDVGVLLRADGSGGIEHVTGAVHYLQPDGSSLLSRGVYTLAEVQAEALSGIDPLEYKQRLDAGYIAGIEVASPAVIPVNMLFSAWCVFEFLCRLHDIRDDDNRSFASQRIGLNQWIFDADEGGERCQIVTRFAGRGDMQPLLGMPELSDSIGVIRVPTA